MQLSGKGVSSARVEERGRRLKGLGQANVHAMHKYARLKLREVLNRVHVKMGDRPTSPPPSMNHSSFEDFTHMIDSRDLTPNSTQACLSN